MRILVLAAIALLALAPAASARPPSFALWMVAESNHEDAITTPLKDGCAKQFAHDDLKAGECLSSVIVRVYPGMYAHWESGVARISRGQAPACKRAIHAYWLAAKKNFAAGSTFFKAHRSSSATELASSWNDEPYVTLKAETAATKSRAIRVCG